MDYYVVVCIATKPERDARTIVLGGRTIVEAKRRAVERARAAVQRNWRVKCAERIPA